MERTSTNTPTYDFKGGFVTMFGIQIHNIILYTMFNQKGESNISVTNLVGRYLKT